MIFNRTLTQPQIQLAYNGRTDRIHADETTVGDVWRACITPNDGISDGLENCSNTLEIRDVCVNLNNASTFIGRMVNLSNRSFIINNNVVLCQKNYSTDTVHPLFVMNGSYTLDCNNSVISNAGLGTAVISVFNDSRVQNCVFENFRTGVNILSMNETNYSVRWLNRSDSEVMSLDISGNLVVSRGSGNAGLLVMYPNGSGVVIVDTGDINPYALAVDASGNYILVGEKSGYTGWYVKKTLPNGTALWSFWQNEALWKFPYAVAVDQQGNLGVGGLGATTPASMLFRKINGTDGSEICNWSKQHYTGSDNYISSVAVDREGNFIIGGYGGHTSGVDWVVTKLSGSCQFRWEYLLGASDSGTVSVASGVAVDHYGAVVAAGSYTDGSGTKTRVIKLNSSGGLVSTYDFPGLAQGYALAVDQDNNYVTGGSVTTGSQDWWVMKISDAGVHLFNWTWNPGSTGAGVSSLAVDAQGDIYAAGKNGTGNYCLGKLVIPKEVMGGVLLENVSVFDMNSTTFVALPNASALASNLSVGHNSTAGKISFSSAAGANGTLAFNRTVLLDPYFVSIDTSQDGKGMNLGANITLLTGDCSYSIWKASGFPQSASEIVSLGLPVSPSYVSCANNITTFSAVNAFSGYTSSGSGGGCVNLSDPDTWSGRLENVSGSNRSFYVINDVTLCAQTFRTETVSPLFMFGGSHTLDCNNSEIMGSGMGSAVISGFSNTQVRNCIFHDFATGLGVFSVNGSGNVTEDWNWTLSPSSGNDVSISLAVDHDGDLVLGGYYSVTTSETEWLVSKVSDGNLVWNWNFSYATTRNSQVSDVAVDRDNNVIAGGFYNVGNSSSDWDWAVRKLSANGSLIWYWNYTKAGIDNLNDVAVDAGGSIYASGRVYNLTRLGYDLRVVKLFSDGSEAWAWQLPVDSFNGYVAVDNDNNVVVGSTNFSGGNYDWKVYKLSSGGNLLWSWSQSPSTGMDVLYSVDVDRENNIVVGGYFTNSSADWRVVKISSAGQTLWNWSFEPSSGTDMVYSLAIDNDNSIVAGGFYYNVDNFDWLVFRLSPEGTGIFNWTLSPSAYNDVAYDVGIDSEGDLAVGGYRNTTSNRDWFAVKLATPKNIMSGVRISNVSVYDSNSTTFIALPNASAEITNLTIGYNSHVGIINFRSVASANGTLANNRTVRLAPSFVSINSSDATARYFNVSANITLEADSCSDLRYYKAAGFHGSADEIISGGSQVIPSYSSCGGGVATFSTVDAFSGYTVGSEGCVDLENASTYRGKVYNWTSGGLWYGYWINDDVTLCQKTYRTGALASSPPIALVINASGITVDCNGSILSGNGAYSGIGVWHRYNVSLLNCSAANYSTGINLNDVNYSNFTNIRSFSNSYGYYLTGVAHSNFVDSMAYNNSDGMYVNYGADLNCTRMAVVNSTNYGVFYFNQPGPSNSTWRDSILCSNPSGSFYFRAGNYSTFYNNTFCNSGFGIHFDMASAYNNISGNLFYGNNRGIWEIGTSAGNCGLHCNSTIFNNTFTNNTIGVNVRGNYTNVSYNRIFNNSMGIEVDLGDEFPVNYIVGNEIANNSLAGISIFPTFKNRTLNLLGNHYYNNGRDMVIGRTLAGAFNISIVNDIFDNPLGNYQNYTNLSLFDSIPESSVNYTINWTRNSAVLPGGKSRFLDRFVRIAVDTAPVSIDSITWHWTDSESSGHDESQFQLYRWNSTAGWTMLNNSPDTAGNRLSMKNLVPSSDYGILESSQSNCPVINESGVYAQEMDFVGAPNSAGGVYGIGPVCLGINANHVIFDCNGYSIIDNSTAGVRAGIFINSSHVNVTVRNCNVSGYNFSIYVADSNSTAIIGNVAFNSTDAFVFENSYYSNISGNTARNTTENGFLLESAGNSTVFNNTAYYCGWRGFRLDLSSSYNLLLSNTAYNNSEDGIALYGGSSYNNITNNTLYSNGWKGLRAEYNSDYNRMVNNTAYWNYEDGLAVLSSNGTYVSENIVYWNAWSGFRVESSGGVNTLFNNSAYNNSAVGFMLNDANNTILYNNSARFNGNSGFVALTSVNCTMINNTAYWNFGSGFMVSSANNAVVSSNNATNNSANGVGVFSSNNVGVSGNVLANNSNYGLNLVTGSQISVRNNTVRGNLVFGMYLQTLTGSVLSGNLIHDNVNSGVYLVTNSRYNNISNNTVYNNGAGGIVLQSGSGNNTLLNNTVYSHPSVGISIMTSSNVSLYNNTVSGCGMGVNVEGTFGNSANDTRLYNTTLYNNSFDIHLENMDIYPAWFNMTGTRILNPSGTYINYTDIGVSDRIDAFTEYVINWTTASVSPPARVSFRNKFVGIINLTAGVSIDWVYWNWLDSELSGYSESRFEIWNYSAGSGWTLLNSTPDTSGNVLSLAGINPSGTYGIFESPVNCPTITSPGIYLQPMDYSGAPNPFGSTGQACVVIGASDVVFDCNGFSITNPAWAKWAIGINQSLRNVTVRNCKNISKYEFGVETLGNQSNLLLSNLTIFDFNVSAIRLADGLGMSNPGNITISGCNIYNGRATVGWGAISLWWSNYTIVRDTEVYNISGGGAAIELRATNHSRIINATLRNSTYGVYIYGISEINDTVENSEIFDVSAGIIFNSGPAGCNISGNMIFNAGSGIELRANSNYVVQNRVLNSSTGIRLSSGASGNIVRMNNITNCTYAGLNFTNGDNNNVSDNILNYSLYGAWLDASSTGNLFYYNRFTNSSVLHASAAGVGNFFNTTNTTSCPVAWNYCARGNYWDDILLRGIADTNADGFGDSGAEYPYNRTNNGNVSLYVVDWGPITTITSSDMIPPNASIIIHGVNGTVVTGTRSVFLNLTYSDDQCMGYCRWGNDDVSDLAARPWENCTTVKAWLLSEAEGNKTVFFQARDCLGNINTTNDTILYFFSQDYTPPSVPAVYDGLEGNDIDWHNSNTSLSAHWSSSSEDISNIIYYRYRIIVNGTSCYANDCNFTGTGTDTSVTVTNLALKENWLYSFDVQAYNPFNISSGTASSNGTRIDITSPNAPIVSSTSHPDETISYPLNEVKLNWTAADIISGGNMSGISGYSFMLDSYPGTAPDSILDGRQQDTLSPMPTRDSFRLLRANSSVASPHTYAVFSQIHANITQNDSITVSVALAELGSDYADAMQVNVYLISVANGAAIAGFNQETNAISGIVNISQDIKYASVPSLAETYQFSLTANTTVSDVSNDIYVVVSGLAADSDNTKDLSIAASTSSVDQSSWAFVCNNSNSCANVSDSTEYAIGVSRSGTGSMWTAQYSLGDGTYYFHVKANDVAGNWGNTTHFRINVAGGGVSVGIVSPVDGTLFTTGSASQNISVKVMVSGNASVNVVVKHPDNSVHPSSSRVFATTGMFGNITIELGTNEIYAVANTSAGAVTLSSKVYVLLESAIAPVSNRTLKVYYGACSASGNSQVCSSVEATRRVGAASEVAGSAPGLYVLADTSQNSIKIFNSKSFDANSVDDYFADNSFLDLKVPSFSFGKKAEGYVVRGELRYPDVFLGGNLTLSPGKYDIYINHWGVTSDGKVNLSMSIR
jgi:parallel beta-helix repeat protein